MGSVATITNETFLRLEGMYSKVFKAPIRKIGRFEGGLSNKTYLLNDHVVARIKEESDKAFYDPKAEYLSLLNKSQEGLAPKIYYFNISNGDCLTEYLDGYSYFVKPSLSMKELKAIGHFISVFHSGKPFKKDFDAIRRYKVYREASAIHLNALEEKEMLRDVLPTLKDKSHFVPCHNDLVRGNILVKGDSIKAIDFEFAGNGCREFDIASFISENSIKEAWQKRAIIEGYLGKHPNEKHMEAIDRMCHFLDALWFYWATSRFSATGDERFKDIADEKLLSFMNYGQKR
jgi:thiamine kinase-like enzyme